MRLFYSTKSNFNRVGFTNPEHLSDPRKAKSQIAYLFTCGGTVIS